MDYQDSTEDSFAGNDYDESEVNGDSRRGGGKFGASGGAGAGEIADDKKLFVGGLSKETTNRDLTKYFSNFGTIKSVNVKIDAATGRSRCFAFIAFENNDSIRKIMEIEDHIINDKKVNLMKAKARPGKIFVGGLKPELTDEEIKAYFATYGAVKETQMPIDKATKKRKAFCFITFEQESVATELLKTPKLDIYGHTVDIKKVTPKPEETEMYANMAARGRGGAPPRGRGRGRGGYGGDQYGGGYGGGYAGGAGYGGGYDDYDYDGYGAGGYGAGGYGAGGYGEDYYGGGGYGGGYGSSYGAGMGMSRGRGRGYSGAQGYGGGYGGAGGYGGGAGGYGGGAGGYGGAAGYGGAQGFRGKTLRGTRGAARRQPY